MPSKKAAPCIIRLSAEQTVRTIAETHTALLRAFNKANAIVLDASKVEDADLTLLQLIESARHTAASLGKPFCMTQPLAAMLNQQLERAGFLNGPASFWKS